MKESQSSLATNYVEATPQSLKESEVEEKYETSTTSKDDEKKEEGITLPSLNGEENKEEGSLPKEE